MHSARSRICWLLILWFLRVELEHFSWCTSWHLHFSQLLLMQLGDTRVRHLCFQDFNLDNLSLLNLLEEFFKSLKEPWVFHVLGYYYLAGDLTAPQALDLLTKEDYTLIDVRTDKEKVKSGVPSLPRNIKNKLFALPWVFFSSILVAKLAIIAQERRKFLFMNNPLWGTWSLEQFHLTLESKK